METKPVTQTRELTRRSSRFSFLHHFSGSRSSLNERIVLEGRLYKLKDNNRGWSKIWIEVWLDSTMRCYTTKAGAPKDTFDLLTLQYIGIPNNEPAIPPPPGPCVFILKNEDKKWIFSASRESEYVYWSNGIKLMLLKAGYHDYDDSYVEENEDSLLPSPEVVYLDDFTDKHGYIEEEIYDELCFEYSKLCHRSSSQEGEICRLNSSLDLYSDVMKERAKAESILRDQYEKLLATLENTNVRLHDALSDLSKLQPATTEYNPRKTMIIQKTDSIDFASLVKQRNQDLLCWLGIFPSDIPKTTKDTEIIQTSDPELISDFDNFIMESSVIQVRHLKKYVAELVIQQLTHEDNFLEIEIKRLKEILKEQLLQSEERGKYLLYLKQEREKQRLIINDQIVRSEIEVFSFFFPIFCIFFLSQHSLRLTVVLRCCTLKVG